jgi:hypothetical protein
VKDCLITAIGSARGASGSIRSLGGEQNWWWLSAVVPSLDVMVKDLGNLPRRSLGETARPSDGNAECREFQHRCLRCRAGLKPGILLGRHSVTASAGFVDKVNGGCVMRRRSRSFEPAGERWGLYLPEQTVALRERHCSPAIWEFLYPSLYWMKRHPGRQTVAPRPREFGISVPCKDEVGPKSRNRPRSGSVFPLIPSDRDSQQMTCSLL